MYITDCFCPFQIRLVSPSQCTPRNHTVSTAQTWHLQTLYVLIFCFSFFFYQCSINSPNSAPEESVLQFSSSCPALLILLLCFLLLQMIYRNIIVTNLFWLGFLVYLPVYEITRDVDWVGIMMIHPPIMPLSRRVISSSVATVGLPQLFNTEI